MPFGGYVVTRFLANNPGHWIAHCHTDYHLADGMGLVLRDAPAGQHEKRVAMPDDFPPCNGTVFEALDSSYIGMTTRPACQCLAPIDEPTLRGAPNEGWLCSTSYNCRHAVVGQTLQEQKRGARGLTRGNWSKPYDSDEEELSRRWVQRGITIGVTLAFTMALACLVKFVKLQDLDLDESSGVTGIHLMLAWRAIITEEYPRRMSSLNMAMAIGLSVVAGLIYLDAGFTDLSERKYGEKISLVFWQCAFWSVSTVYGATVSYHSPKWAAIHGKMVHLAEKKEAGAAKISPASASSAASSDAEEEAGTDWSTTPGQGQALPSTTEKPAEASSATEEGAGPRRRRRASWSTTPSQGQALSSTTEKPAEASSAAEEGAGAGWSTTPSQSQALSSTTEKRVGKLQRSSSTSSTGSIVLHQLVRSTSAAMNYFGHEMKVHAPHFHKKRYTALVMPIWQYHLLRLAASLLLSSPWPILYALVIDCLAVLSPSISSTLLVGVILVLNAQAFEAMGQRCHLTLTLTLTPNQLCHEPERKP